jgi:MFS family permease
MRQSHPWIIPLCLASVCWAFSFGLSAPLASLVLRDAGFGDTIVGLNTGTYYLGIALTAGLVPRLLRRGGHRCLVWGMIASGVSAGAFFQGDGLIGWFILRALNGATGAISLIPLETYVNQQSAPERRAQNFGCYAFCIALGMALGTLVGMQLYAHWPRTAFVVGGVVPLLGAGVVAVWRPCFPTVEEQCQEKTALGLARNFLGFGSAWSQGFLEGGMVGLLPIYLLAVGLSDTAVSWIMSGLMIGVILAQVPLAWLADRLGRVVVLAGCNLVALLGIACLYFETGIGWLAFWLFVVGATSGAFYPLGLALLGERLPAAGLARASAWYLAINCLGSLTGPVVAGAVMDQFGRHALFLAGGGAVLLVLVTWVAVGRRHGRVPATSESAIEPTSPARMAA